jgi:ectoine hydroxylase-related dioxygenase (phytanoyl-CoA dioxygenase family)
MTETRLVCHVAMLCVCDVTLHACAVFACAAVPGSHHAQLPLPSNDSGDPAGHKRVLHPQMQAGDLLFFMGGATTHGAWSW